MIATFDRSGIAFQYPSNWTLDVQEDDDGWTATVESADTAFVIVGLRPGAESTAAVVEEVLAALREEYKEIDVVDAIESLAGEPALGHDIDFLTLDTTVHCQTRCLQAPAGPVLVMYQVSEYDRDRNEDVLRAILASLVIDDE